MLGKTVPSPRSHKVSIIVPTYNSSSTLKECLESIRKQNYPTYEIIIIDNYSTDSTVELARKYGAKIIYHRGNAASAKNVGITKSSGRYFFILDSDQIVSRTLIAECVLICSDIAVAAIDIPEVFIGKGFWSRCSADWKNLYFITSKNFVASTSTYGVSVHKDDEMGFEPRFFAKEQVKTNGFFNEKLVWGEDHDFHLRLRKLHLKEAWCISRIYHFEPRTLAQILHKNFSYGKSMSRLQSMHRRIPWLAIKHTFYTIREGPRLIQRSIPSWIGIFILLGLRTLARAAGMLAHHFK